MHYTCVPDNHLARLARLMNGPGSMKMTSLWSVSTEAGANLTADELVGALGAQHGRVLGTWEGLSPEQWAHPSRNPEWSVHDTARHGADAMDVAAAQVLDEPLPFPMAGFDPRTTPDTWLALSAHDEPSRTMERYANASERYREGVGDRVAAGDSSLAPTPYGPAHWTTMVVHILWDAWIHERDTNLPLGLAADSTTEEQRLACIYGLLMAMVPLRMMERSLEVSVIFTGHTERPVTAAHQDGLLSSGEVAPTDTVLSGELCELVDSLSGRGTRLDDLLPVAPAPLYVFAKFMSS